MLNLPILFIDMQEIIIIMIVAVIIFGPKKIPEIARGLGEGLRAMRSATNEIKREIMDQAKEIDPTKEFTDTRKQIEEEVAKNKKEIEDTIGPVKRELRGDSN